MSDLRVFKRYEKKYLLSADQFESFFAEYRDRLVPDEYHESLIQNVYYDTDNYRLVRDSIDKPVYKEKLRLRCYNEIRPGENAYLEIKKKYEGIVYKRREKINIDVMKEFIEGKSGEDDEKSQIGKELEWFVKYYGSLKPAMYLSYRRKAWLVKGTDIRITFDTDITWRTNEIDLIKGSYGEKLLEEGTVLMELKCGEAIPLDIVRLFTKYSIYPTSFSKYGAAYAVLTEEVARKAAETAAKAYRSPGERKVIWHGLGKVAGM